MPDNDAQPLDAAEDSFDPQGSSEPVKPTPPKDPETGRFISPRAHPDYLVEDARDFGFTDDDIADMSSATLARQVRRMRQQQEKLRDQLSTARTIETRPAAQPTEPAAEEEPDLGLSEDIHPEIKSALGKLWKEKQDLAKRLAERDQRDQEREVKTAIEHIDAAFAVLGPKYEKVFGKGDGRDLGEDQQAEFKRRIACLNAAGVDVRNISPNRLRKQVKDAAEMLFGAGTQDPPPAPPKPGDVYANVKNGKSKPRISAEDWEEGTLARPSAREGAAEPDGEAKAKRNLARKLDEPLPDTQGDSDLLDTLP